MTRDILYILFLISPTIILGQQTPIPFMPNMFENYPNVRDITISPEGNEVYFTIDDIKSRVAILAYIKKKGNIWSKPKEISFTGKYRDIEPAFSPDGKRLFFVSNRPIHKDSINPKDYDIWYVDRTELGWSKPKNIGSPINTNGNEFYPSITNKGDIYFTSEREGAIGAEDIFVSRLKEGAYQKPVSINGEVNTKYFEFNSYVSPDESYIIFSAQRPNEGTGGGDLYISYKKKDSWSKGQLIENINTPYLEFCPFVDSKTNKLYFTSQQTNVKRYYEEPLDVDDFLSLFQSGKPKGLIRLYHVDFKSVVPKSN